MAANVESLFYVREKPWHGLGKELNNPPTSKEAIIAAGLDWRVDSLPIYDIAGREVQGYKANTRDSDGKVLGVVGKKYCIVQNEDAFDFTDSLVDEGMVYETAGSLQEGKKIWLLGKMPETQILNDKVDPYVCFVNSHDGTGAIKVCLSTVRVVCNNTLNFALSTAKRKWSTIHVGNLELKLQEAKATLGLINVYNDELKKDIEKLAIKHFSENKIEEIFDSLFPIDYTNDSKRRIENVNIMKSKLIDCYNAPDISNFKNTGYGILNAVSDFISHSTPLRLTDTYKEKNFEKIINGHPVLDYFYNAVKAA